jgi:hypothetical protein
VTASIVDGRIRFAASAAFAIRDGTSGFFEGLGIEAGRYGSRTSEGVKGSKGVIEAMADVSALMNDLFGSSDVSVAAKNRLRQAFESIAARAFGKSGPRYDSGFGVRMDFRSGVDDILSFTQNDRDRLAQALQTRHVTLRKFFLSPISEKGESFLDALSTELKSVESEIEGQLSGTGLLLNIRA